MAFVSQPKQRCSKKLEHLTTSGASRNKALHLYRQVSVDAGNHMPDTISVSKGTIVHRMPNLIKKNLREKEEIEVIAQHLLKERASIML